MSVAVFVSVCTGCMYICSIYCTYAAQNVTGWRKEFDHALDTSEAPERTDYSGTGLLTERRTLMEWALVGAVLVMLLPFLFIVTIATRSGVYATFGWSLG